MFKRLGLSYRLLSSTVTSLKCKMIGRRKGTGEEGYSRTGGTLQTMVLFYVYSGSFLIIW